MCQFSGSKQYVDTLETMNIIFMWIFTVESIVRWFAVGTHQFVRNLWYMFDLGVVLLSVVIFFVEVSNALDSTSLQPHRLYSNAPSSLPTHIAYSLNKQ